MHHVVHRLDKEAIGRLSRFLGAIHCSIGVGHQLRWCACIIGIKGHANADMQADFIARGGQDRLRHRLDHAFCNQRGTLCFGQVRGDDGKHIAREPCTGVLFAHCRAQATGNGAERFIADIGTKPVVDRPEVVDIDHQNRKQLFIALGVRNRLVKAILEQGVVGKAGQRVVRGQIAQPVDRCVGRRIVMQGDVNAVWMRRRWLHRQIADDVHALCTADNPFTTQFLVTAIDRQQHLFL